MAEAVFASEIKKHNLYHLFEYDSAGTAAYHVEFMYKTPTRNNRNYSEGYKYIRY